MEQTDWEFNRLAEIAHESRRLMVLTGAGISTESGIPAYRDTAGSWKHSRPVLYKDFVSDVAVRKRYWARSLVGWKRISDAEPNAGHSALARLEVHGHVHVLVTQNVDGLHQRAGHQNVIDLHGRLDTVICLACSRETRRDEFQSLLENRNPDWTGLTATTAPDGDAALENVDFEAFDVPACDDCRGMLKPDVVFFGENVPRDRLARAMRGLEEADALLIAGSSLMVFSGYRFAREAHRRGLPVCAVNIGRTRADAEIGLKIEAACGEVLPRLARRLTPARPPI